jgi:hypothetical protein
MCCLCIQFTHENTSERTILHLVKKKRPPLQGMVACTAKKASYAPVSVHEFTRVVIDQYNLGVI